MPDTITRTGKLFTAGDYPDKQFSLTEEELTAAIEHFAPVAANLQHRESLLDGKLGGLQKVWRQGKELFGEIQIPAWLHETVGSEPIKPSLEWDRATKRICGLAYVVSPRIADAALMSAFSAWETSHAELTVSIPADFTLPDRPTKEFVMSTTIANPTPLDKIKALLGLAGVTPEKADAVLAAANFSVSEPSAPVNFSDSPEYKAMTARLDAQKAEVDAHKAAFAAQSALAIQRDAAAFATEQVTSLRAFPAEKDVIAAAFAQAAADDAAAPVTVTFGAGDADKGSRVDALKALFNARTPHTRTVSQVAQSAAAVFTASADKTVDAKAKEEELLLQTELGRTVLAERRAAEKK